jgi:outer membrane protein assembly factor BamD (BamD/ComL family)
MAEDTEAERIRLHAELRDAVAAYDELAATTPLGNTESAILAPGMARERQDRVQAAQAALDEFNREHPI